MNLRRKKVDRYGNVRLNLRLDPALCRFAKVYAAANNTSVTQIIVDFLTELRKRETNGERVDQI